MHSFETQWEDTYVLETRLYMEIAVEAEGLRRSQYATAIIFPSVECADEKHLTFFACDTEEMVLTGHLSGNPNW